MNLKRFKQIRAAVALFVGMIVSIAVTMDNYLLAIAGVVSGMLFLILVRTKVKIRIDEREKTIREKAAQMTYAIFAPTIGLGAFFLIFLGKNSLYLATLGQVFAYLTLFLIALYALSYHFIGRKYGGGEEDEE